MPEPTRNIFAGTPSGLSQAGQKPGEWMMVGSVVVRVQGTAEA